MMVCVRTTHGPRPAVEKDLAIYFAAIANADDEGGPGIAMEKILKGVPVVMIIIIPMIVIVTTNTKEENIPIPASTQFSPCGHQRNKLFIMNSSNTEK
ncbi:uncharacterized protein LOC117565545 isoform X7 [Drosophila albomicans]|uniref:Uncharacterized protein LOC117565545 isoform X7 n=1 Tax=Drosophila albomicans TaxID=7291 RepID=A0A6P8WAG9_DROAB|nr:uncharacterized protein LOC117565545 isoform X7 [Drosophila albomicans]